MKKSIVWLSSYPKSGNTWVRMFLANYLENGDAPLPINRINKYGFADHVADHYRKAAGPAADLSDPRQVVALRPRVLNALNTNGATINFVKTHNAITQAFGVPLIPPELTQAAIYIVRNPLDVALSYARHFSVTHEEAVDRMSSSSNVTTPNDRYVAHYLGSWSDHVQSWRMVNGFAVHVVRYEDLLETPERSFGGILRAAGLPVDPPRVEKAVRFSTFDEAARQEEATGFVEKTDRAERFFSVGGSGQWKTDLAPELARRLRKAHRRDMKKLGYLE
ncbi:sulfotransferase domain-containing protein [Roseovarius salis]|uniref:sulfotransferase domain-containing protein n=1 Tax=Roseovarius salis TaxID=3376063 RepID=UPI0037C62800